MQDEMSEREVVTCYFFLLIQFVGGKNDGRAPSRTGEGGILIMLPAGAIEEKGEGVVDEDAAVAHAESIVDNGPPSPSTCLFNSSVCPFGMAAHELLFVSSCSCSICEA